MRTQFIFNKENQSITILKTNEYITYTLQELQNYLKISELSQDDKYLKNITLKNYFNDKSFKPDTNIHDIKNIQEEKYIDNSIVNVSFNKNSIYFSNDIIINNKKYSIYKKSDYTNINNINVISNLIGRISDLLLKYDYLLEYLEQIIDVYCTVMYDKNHYIHKKDINIDVNEYDTLKYILESINDNLTVIDKPEESYRNLCKIHYDIHESKLKKDFEKREEYSNKTNTLDFGLLIELTSDNNETKKEKDKLNYKIEYKFKSGFTKLIEDYDLLNKIIENYNHYIYRETFNIKFANILYYVFTNEPCPTDYDGDRSFYNHEVYKTKYVRYLFHNNQYLVSAINNPNKAIIRFDSNEKPKFKVYTFKILDSNIYLIYGGVSNTVVVFLDDEKLKRLINFNSYINYDYIGFDRVTLECILTEYLKDYIREAYYVKFRYFQSEINYNNHVIINSIKIDNKYNKLLLESRISKFNNIGYINECELNIHKIIEEESENNQTDYIESRMLNNFFKLYNIIDKVENDDIYNMYKVYRMFNNLKKFIVIDSNNYKFLKVLSNNYKHNEGKNNEHIYEHNGNIELVRKLNIVRNHYYYNNMYNVFYNKVLMDIIKISTGFNKLPLNIMNVSKIFRMKDENYYINSNTFDNKFDFIKDKENEFRFIELYRMIINFRDEEIINNIDVYLKGIMVEIL